MKKNLFFRNSKGRRLSAILSCPASARKSQIVILCHGFSSSKESKTNVRLEAILNQNRICTLRFDFFGHGESDGRFEETTISKAVDDILSVIEFLNKSGYDKMGLVGSSFGGMASLIAASKTKDLIFLALKSPVSDCLSRIVVQFDEQAIQGWREKRFISVTSPNGETLRLNYSFFDDAEKVDAYASCEKIKIPTLIVHGDSDETVPLVQSQKASLLIENCRLEIIKGADHRYTRPEEFEKMLDLISGFVIEHSQELKA